MSVKPIVIKITAFGDQASRVFGDLSKRSDALGKRLERVGGLSSKIGGGLLGGAAVGAFALGLNKIPGQLIEVEETAARLAFTEKFTAEQSALVGRAVKDMSRETLQGQTDLLKAVDTIGDAGFALGETLSILPAAAKQATAFGQPMEVTAGIAKTLGSNFKIAADEMSGAIDVVTELGTANFDLNELAEVLPRIGQASQALNLNGKAGLSQFAAGLEIVRGEMRDSGAAAKGFSKLLEGVFDPATMEKFKKGPRVDVMAELEQAAKRGQNQFEAYLALVQRVTDTGNPITREARIKDLFGDQDAAAVRALLDNLGQYRAAISKYNSSNGATEKGFAAQLETTRGKLQSLRTTVLSTDFKPMAQGITILNRALDWLNQGNGENAEKAIKRIVLAAEVGAGFYAIGRLSSALKDISTAFSIISKGGPAAIKVIEKVIGLKAVEAAVPGDPFSGKIPKGAGLGGVGATAAIGIPAILAYGVYRAYKSAMAEGERQFAENQAGGPRRPQVQTGFGAPMPLGFGGAPMSNPEAVRAAAGARPSEVSGTITVMLPNAPKGTRVATDSAGGIDFNPQLGMGR